MTKETAPQYLPLVQALAEGKVIQLSVPGSAEWTLLAEPTFQYPPDRYRIKPEPRRVPLGPEDVPPGSVFRWKTKTSSWVTALFVSQTSVWLATSGSGDAWSYETLMEKAEIKRPGSDWQPCSKEE